MTSLLEDECELLADIIEQRYPAVGVSLHLLANGGKSVYRVRRAEGPAWVLRAYRPPDAEATGRDDPAGTLAAMLLFLEDRHYPAERVILGADGSAAVSHKGWRLLVTMFMAEPLQACTPVTSSSNGSAKLVCGTDDFTSL